MNDFNLNELEKAKNQFFKEKEQAETQQLERVRKLYQNKLELDDFRQKKEIALDFVRKKEIEPLNKIDNRKKNIEENQIENNSNDENLRIIAESEKIYQEIIYKSPLEQLQANILHNEKYPIIPRDLMESAITEVLWSNEDNSL